MAPGKIFIALDGMTRGEALFFTKKLTCSRYGHFIAGFKIHDLWDRYGSAIIADLRRSWAKTIWLDVKLHDTPKTLRLRALALRDKGIDILSVHAGSGIRGMQAAVSSGLKIVAVTVLTSLDKKEVQKIYGSSPANAVRSLFALAKEAGVWGLVCSAEEVNSLPKHGKIKIVVPGIQLKKRNGVNQAPRLGPRLSGQLCGTVLRKRRLLGVISGNQRRTGTALETLKLGADYLVIGSAITNAKDPIKVFEQIVSNLN